MIRELERERSCIGRRRRGTRPPGDLARNGTAGVTGEHEAAIEQERAALTPAPRRPQATPYDTTAELPLMPAGANRPLAGIVVLDFGQVYQGPYATLLMAKAGADVIKIEPPQGEPLRRRGAPGQRTACPHGTLSSNKRG